MRMLSNGCDLSMRRTKLHVHSEEAVSHVSCKDQRVCLKLGDSISKHLCEMFEEKGITAELTLRTAACYYHQIPNPHFVQ